MSSLPAPEPHCSDNHPSKQNQAYRPLNEFKCAPSGQLTTDEPANTDLNRSRDKHTTHRREKELPKGKMQHARNGNGRCPARRDESCQHDDPRAVPINAVFRLQQSTWMQQSLEPTNMQQPCAPSRHEDEPQRIATDDANVRGNQDWPQQRGTLGNKHSGWNIDDVFADWYAHATAQQQQELDHRYERFTVLLEQFLHIKSIFHGGRAATCRLK